MGRARDQAQEVFIAGESPLVEEYAAACLAAGFRVGARFNSGSVGRLPAGVRRAARPSRRALLALELTNTSTDAKRMNIREIDRALAPDAPVLSSSAAVTVAEQSTWTRGARRLLGIAALPSMLGGSLVEIAPSADAAGDVVDAACGFIRALGKEPAIVQDSPGMVLPRILCMLVNEAHFALGEGIAGGGDIDTAMKLGTHYPHGPLEWGESITHAHVRAVLDGIRRSYGEERYRIAPSLAGGAGHATGQQ